MFQADEWPDRWASGSGGQVRSADGQPTSPLPAADRPDPDRSFKDCRAEQDEPRGWSHAAGALVIVPVRVDRCVPRANGWMVSGAAASCGRDARGKNEKTPPRFPCGGVIKPASTYFPAKQYHRRVGLNFCVRDGNRCDPDSIDTDKAQRSLSAALNRSRAAGGVSRAARRIPEERCGTSPHRLVETE